jgi:hypothetical protein
MPFASQQPAQVFGAQTVDGFWPHAVAARHINEMNV